MMSIPFRARVYFLLRRVLKFPDWERYTREVTTGDPHKLSVHYLDELLHHAVTQVPYYRALSKQFTDTHRMNLSDFPILNKTLLRENFEAMSSETPQKKAFFNSSGGSTGTPQRFLQDREFLQWSLASLTYYHRNFLRVEYATTSKVVLWGSERDLFKQNRGFGARLLNWMTQTHFFNSFKMTPEMLEECVRTLNQLHPHFIKGYAGSLYELARYIQANDRSVPRPAFLYSSAETLRPFMRETIEAAFGAKVYDFYGSREVGAIAGECAQGLKHLFTFNNWVEVVDQHNRPVQPGEEGRVLITTLHNRSMPLIRYEIGDTAILGKACTCGSPLPTLERVTGRVVDHFKTAQDEKIHGEYFTHLFYFREWTDRFQVLQETLHKIRLFVILKEGLTPSQEERADIDSKIRLVMGEDCVVEWEFVSDIPLTPQGKFLFTRSLLHD